MTTLEDLWYGNITPFEQYLDGNENTKNYSRLWHGIEKNCRRGFCRCIFRAGVQSNAPAYIRRGLCNYFQSKGYRSQKNTAAHRHQEKADIAMDKLSVKEYADPFS